MFFFFSSRRRHTRYWRDWSSDVCSSDLGMGSTILDGAIVGDQSLVGARALVTPGIKIPPGSLVLGSPAKVVRKLTRKERTGLKRWAEKYVRYAAYCLKHGINVATPLAA